MLGDLSSILRSWPDLPSQPWPEAPVIGFLMIKLILCSTVASCIQEGADNSTFTPDNPSTLHNFGDELTYICNPGYNHSLGDLVRTCQSNGEWSGDLPTCPSELLHGKILTFKVPNSTIAEFAYIVVPDEMTHYEPFHLYLHCCLPF